MRRLAALSLVFFVVVAGCGNGNGGGGGTDRTTTTRRPTTVAPGSSTTTGESTVVAVYLMRGDKLGVAHRTLGPGPAVLKGALEELLKGPTAPDRAAGLTTNIPEGTTLRGVSISDGTATVDLSKTFESGGGSLSMFSRLAQVTFTATQFPTVQRVKLRLDGKDVSSFSSEGLLLPDTLTRADTGEDILPAILVEDPAPGDTVGRRFTAKGSSNTFEATHQLQVLAPDGTKLVDTFVTATSGTGTRGTWEKVLELPAGTSGAITLRVFEASAQDGSPLHQVDIPLTAG